MINEDTRKQSFEQSHEEVVHRVCDYLNTRIQSMDETVINELDNRRRQVLASPKDEPSNRFKRWFLDDLNIGLPSIMMKTAAVGAVVLMLTWVFQPFNSSTQQTISDSLNSQEFELLVASEDMELLSRVEFLQWASEYDHF